MCTASSDIPNSKTRRRKWISAIIVILFFLQMIAFGVLLFFLFQMQYMVTFQSAFHMITDEYDKSMEYFDTGMWRNMLSATLIAVNIVSVATVIRGFIEKYPVAYCILQVLITAANAILAKELSDIAFPLIGTPK